MKSVILIILMVLTAGANAQQRCEDVFSRSQESLIRDLGRVRIKPLLGRLLSKRSVRNALGTLSVDEAYDILLPAARGLERSDTIFPANEAIRRLALIDGERPRRFASRTERSEKDILLHEPIRSLRRLKSSGANEVFIIQFTNGRRAIFKPLIGQRNIGPDPSTWIHRLAAPREASAYEIVESVLQNRRSREAGLSHVEIPATVEVILPRFGLGSLQMFVENTHTPNGESLGDIEIRTRVFDFILGNPDRFENPGYSIPHYERQNLNNILLTSEGSRAILIDNAFGRPAPPEFSTAYLPPAASIPTDLRRALFEFDEPLFRRTYAHQMSAEGIDDVILRVRAVRALISDSNRRDL